MIHTVTRTEAIRIDGTATKNDEKGAVLFVAMDAGEVILYVWADKESQDPTHRIDLSEARQ